MEFIGTASILSPPSLYFVPISSFTIVDFQRKPEVAYRLRLAMSLLVNTGGATPFAPDPASRIMNKRGLIPILTPISGKALGSLVYFGIRS